LEFPARLALHPQRAVDEERLILVLPDGHLELELDAAVVCEGGEDLHADVGHGGAGEQEPDQR